MLAGLGVADATTAAELIRRELNYSLIEERAQADIEEWNEIAFDYGDHYWTTSPTELFRALMIDIIALRAALSRCGEGSFQKELKRVGALFAAFMAQSAENLGSMVEARRWWRTARRGGDESGDPYVALWIRGREVVCATSGNRSPERIIRLVEDAEKFIERAPTKAVLQLLAGKAQTFAVMGRHSEAQAVLRELSNLFEESSSSATNSSGFEYPYGEQRLHFAASFVYSHLADAAKADEARCSALPFYPPGDLRQPAQLELHRALCLVRGRDLTDGTRHAQEIITSLPDGHRTASILSLGHKVLRAIPSREVNNPTVAEYRECLAASSSASQSQISP